MPNIPVEDIAVEFPVSGVVTLKIKTKKGWHAFTLNLAKASTMAFDMNAGLLGPQAPANQPTPSTAHQMPLPDVLELPLVVEPIQTAEMSNYPDGLAVQLHMHQDFPMGAFQKVRLPMFADTARALIGALEQRLSKMQPTPPKKN